MRHANETISGHGIKDRGIAVRNRNSCLLVQTMFDVIDNALSTDAHWGSNCSYIEQIIVAPQQHREISPIPEPESGNYP
ncbi:MAG: hypothetical protein ACLQUZ_04460 [Rhizomicrobium sp.]